MAVFSRADKRKQVLAVMDEIARSIDHLPRPALLKILPILKQAHLELEGDLRGWLARHQGATLFSTQRYRNALVMVRHAMKRAERRLGPSITDALWGSTDRIGNLAMHHLILELEKFGAIFEGTVHPTSIDQAAAIASGDSLLWPRFQRSAARYAGSIGEGLVQELAVSRIRSETMSELTTRLQRRMPALFLADRAGAARLARTETMSAYNTYHMAGLMQIAQDDPEIVVRWDASFDFRRCPMCASLDGQVRDVARGEKFHASWFARSGKRAGGRMVKHERDVDQPPAHPNCRCVPTPWNARWEADLGHGRVSRQEREYGEGLEAA